MSHRSFNRLVLPTDNARRLERFEIPGDRVIVLSQPSGLNPQVRLDNPREDPFDLSEFGYFSTDEPFSVLYLSHDAVPGGVLVIAIATGINPRPGPIRSVAIGTVDQGIAGAQEWGVADNDARASLLALEVLTANAFRSGAPHAEEVVCTIADDPYDSDARATLGRNARRGFVRAKTTNAGTLSVWISHDGATFTGVPVELEPGESWTLDGFDVDTVRVASTAADDVATVVLV